MDSTQLDLLKLRIPYDVDVFSDLTNYALVLNSLLDDSKYKALSLRYPFQDYSDMELPAMYKNWQLRCAVEIYNNYGNEGIKDYAENGISWSRINDGISQSLIDEIIPMAGYITPSVDVEEV